MGSIAALLFGAVVGTGLFFFSPERHAETTPVPALPGSSAAERLHNTAAAPTADIAAADDLNGREGGETAEAPVDKEKEGGDKPVTPTEELGREISKEMQSLVENYWVDKINGYKARIDEILNRNDLEELNRLRVRWALADKSRSPMAFAAQMEMNAVNAQGESTEFGTSIGNADTKSDVRVITSDAAANGKTSMTFSVTSEANDIDANTEEGKNVTSIRNVSVIRYNSQDGQAEPDEANISIAVADDDTKTVTIDGTGNRMIVVQPNPKGERTDAEGNGEQTVENRMKKTHTIILQRNGTEEESEEVRQEMTMITRDMDSEGFGMGAMMGMLKASISADNSESSRILVATWDIAEGHRAELDDLKATVMNDVAAFAALMRVKMAEYVAERGDELPDGMRETMSEKLEAKQEENTANLLKTLEPVYGVIIEPMLLLYNGSDINGMLTSAIAEPVAGVTLEANSTLKQSYPNPASAEATIEYTLREPSSATVLRLFDAQGGEVRNMNLGAQGTGDHRTVLNVRDLPSGTYLYHLTVNTSGGAQVFSKTMQITR